MIAIAFTLSCVGLIIFVWTQFGGTIPFAAQGYRVKALFSETGLLVPNADVRISGVNIGKVTAVQPEGINSLVTMDINQQYAPIPSDTRAILRQKTLLGEAYVELSTGNGSGPKLGDEGTIPNSQVAPTQQLDQVLNSFTPQTQHNLQEFLLGTGQALAGRGQDLNDAIGNFDPTVTELEAVVGELNQESGDLQGVINNGATVLNTLGDRAGDLQTLVTAGDSVLSATADQNTALTRTVNDLPAFLTNLRTTLTTLNTTLGLAKPSLAALEPAAPLLTPALADLTKLSGPLLTLLRQAPSVLHDAKIALPAIAAFNRAFKPGVDALLPAAENVAPMIGILGEYHEEITAGMTNLAADLLASAPAQVPGGTANYLRALVTIGDDSEFGQSVRQPELRANTFFSPGELSYIGQGGLLSANCSNTANSTPVPAPFGNVPCRLQPAFPWGHGVKTAYYPRITKAKP
jgi:phospholipid/cholesterol/gamma-HCH transport system substrate-binding protein